VGRHTTKNLELATEKNKKFKLSSSTNIITVTVVRAFFFFHSLFLFCRCFRLGHGIFFVVGIFDKIYISYTPPYCVALLGFFEIHSMAGPGAGANMAGATNAFCILHLQCDDTVVIISVLYPARYSTVL
jgi:hypothetical protein